VSGHEHPASLTAGSSGNTARTGSSRVPSVHLTRLPGPGSRRSSADRHSIPTRTPSSPRRVLSSSNPLFQLPD
jgi:hypothetical protein